MVNEELRCNLCLRPIERGEQGTARSLVPDDPMPTVCIMNVGWNRRGDKIFPGIHIVCCSRRVQNVTHHADCTNKDRPHPDTEYFQRLDRVYAPTQDRIDECVNDLEKWVS